MSFTVIRFMQLFACGNIALLICFKQATVCMTYLTFEMS